MPEVTTTARIQGSATEHIGKSASFSAPSSSGENSVLRSALRDARVSGTAINVGECHGTGTSLGDPIEVGALTNVLCGSNPVPPRMLGTLKTNLAHTESASGILGLIKCLLQLHHSSGPANLHLRRLNKYIDLPSRSSIGLPTATYRLSRATTSPFYGIVGAFGATGCNAEAVLSGAPSSSCSLRRASRLLSARRILTLKAATWV